MPQIVERNLLFFFGGGAGGAILAGQGIQKSKMPRAPGIFQGHTHAKLSMWLFVCDCFCFPEPKGLAGALAGTVLARCPFPACLDLHTTGCQLLWGCVREEFSGGDISHSLRIYPYPMVWPVPRPWSETMVSIPL